MNIDDISVANLGRLFQDSLGIVNILGINLLNND